MLKCEVGKDIDCKLELDGTVYDAIDDICNIVQGVHASFERHSPGTALLFRVLLFKTLGECEVWAPLERNGDK